MAFLESVASALGSNVVGGLVRALGGAITGQPTSGGPRVPQVYRKPNNDEFLKQFLASKAASLETPTPTPISAPTPPDTVGARPGEHSPALQAALQRIRDRWGGGAASALSTYNSQDPYTPPMSLPATPMSLSGPMSDRA
jgi:hypothetical protein